MNKGMCYTHMTRINLKDLRPGEQGGGAGCWGMGWEKCHSIAMSKSLLFEVFSFTLHWIHTVALTSSYVHGQFYFADLEPWVVMSPWVIWSLHEVNVLHVFCVGCRVKWRGGTELALVHSPHFQEATFHLCSCWERAEFHLNPQWQKPESL